MQSVINFKPDYIFYQTGVDPLKEDLYGKMDLTLEGLIQRDSIILQYAFDNHIPISLALGGGYAKPIELSVNAYANTYRVAKNIWKPNLKNLQIFIGIDQTGAVDSKGRPKPLNVSLIDLRKKDLFILRI